MLAFLTCGLSNCNRVCCRISQSLENVVMKWLILLKSYMVCIGSGFMCKYEIDADGHKCMDPFGNARLIIE